MKREVLCGADRLDSIKTLIDGKRCGLLTSASGVTRFGVPTYSILASKYNLSVLFAPEHGVRSVLQAGGWGGAYIDSETGVPVYDLPGGGNPDIDQALSLCDVVIYDIQDVGARFYTYIYCLTYIMEECSKRSIPVIVLDRPNPISGNMEQVEGAILDEDRYSSFIGKYALPVRYSMTCGEFARYINEEKSFGCELMVVECEGWERKLYYDELSLPWINPSPNIPSVDCSINYIGTCLLEATNASEGRGTTRPFDIVGAPYVDSRKLCDMMNSYGLEGVFFSRAYFTPMFSKWKGEGCEGVQFNITDRLAYNPHAAGVYLIRSLMEYSGFDLSAPNMNLRYGLNSLSFDGGFDPRVILESEKAGIDAFVAKVKKHLLYS